ncbi:MAG: hypothetical protein H6R46_1008 [Proteobacteria bacterium]|nr:hypothetical protein [Pseudomonadota bacterium]
MRDIRNTTIFPISPGIHLLQNVATTGEVRYKLFFCVLARIERLHTLGELRPVVLLLHLDQPAHRAAPDHAFALAAVLDAIERLRHVGGFAGVVAGRG